MKTINTYIEYINNKKQLQIDDYTTQNILKHLMENYVSLSNMY